MEDIQCIYCLEIKSSSSYKKSEHVIPKSFGKFKNNFTLTKEVCDQCNQFFGDNLEIVFARDTFEGLLRYELGIKDEDEYKSMGNKSRQTIIIQEKKYKGAYAYLKYSPISKKRTLIPLPQIGFYVDNSKEILYVPIDQLPSKNKLINLGVNLDNICFLGASQEIVTKKLKEIGIEFETHFEEREKDGFGKVNVEVSGQIRAESLRTIAKIALNYLTYFENKEFVLSKPFDNIRSFIRYGKLPNYQIVEVHKKSILESELNIDFNSRKLGHIIRYDHGKSGLFFGSQVSLFNYLTYDVILSNSLSTDKSIAPKGSFFNISSKKIKPLSII